jgi:subtilisin family serine protease
MRKIFAALLMLVLAYTVVASQIGEGTSYRDTGEPDTTFYHDSAAITKIAGGASERAGDTRTVARWTLPGHDLPIPQTLETAKSTIEAPDKRDIPMRVIVHLKEPETVWPSEVSSMSVDKVNALRSTMREHVIQTDVGLDSVGRRYSSFNGFSASVGTHEFEALMRNPLVHTVEEDRRVQAFLHDSVGVIGTEPVWSKTVSGHALTGSGQSVCIIDSGVDYTHPDLGGCAPSSVQDAIIDPVYPAITSPNYPSNYPDNYENTWTITKSGYERISVYFNDFRTEDLWLYEGEYYLTDYVEVMDSNYTVYATYWGDLGSFWSVTVPGNRIRIRFVSDVNTTDRGFSINQVRMGKTGYPDADWSACSKVVGGYDFVYGTNDPADLESHGTHVAGIVAADGSITGVSPDASIVAVRSLDVDGGWTSDIVSGIEYCIQKRNELNISVISMSLGGSNYSAFCDSTEVAFRNAINAATNAGLSVVVATGNDGISDAVSAPACVQNAIRVGSSVKADTALSAFSNRWQYDMLVAPGSGINSTVPGPDLEAYDGTSMAAPHVSGAIAIIRQYLALKDRTLTPKQIESVLRETGTIITQDGRDYYRIDVLAALLSLDETPPILELGVEASFVEFAVGSVGINWSADYELSSIDRSALNVTYPNGTLLFSSPANSGTIVLSPENLTSPGSYEVTLWAVDESGKESVFQEHFVVNDTIPPLINSIELSRSIIQSGTPVVVTVNATDNVEVASVLVDGIALNHTGTIWNGTVVLVSPPLAVVVTDHVGNTAENTSTYIVDDTVPAISDVLIAPTFATIGDVVNITFTATDEYLNAISVHLNGIPAVLNRTVGDTYEYHYLVLGSEQEGPIEANITVSDLAGNRQHHYESIIFDLAPPNITALWIEREVMQTNATVEVSMNVTEGNLDRAYANTQPLECVGDTIDKICSASIIVNTTTITFEVWDLAGNRDHDNVTVVLDDVPPMIHNTTLSSNLTRTGSLISIAANVTDNVEIAQVTIHGIRLEEDEGIWSAQFRVYAETLVLRVTDTALNTVETELAVTLDDEPPHIEAHILYDDEAVGPAWAGHPVWVHLNASDANDISSIEWRFTNTSWAVYSEPFEITDAVPGERLLYRATDSAGNRAVTRQIPVRVDTLEPTITRSFVNTNTTYPGGSVNVFVEADDAHSGVSFVNVTINGTSYSGELIDGYYQAALHAPDAPGEYAIDIVVADAAQNTASDRIDLIVVVGAPVIIPSMANGSYVTNATVVGFEFFNVSEGTYNTSISTEWTALEDEILVADVSPFVIVFNMTSGETVFEYLIDSTNPSLVIDPLPPFVNGTYPIGFSCTDTESGVVSRRLHINDELIAEPTATYDLDTLRFADGTNTLRIDCFDRAGNLNRSEAHIEIRNYFPIVVEPENGTSLFEDTHLRDYLNMITSINSSDVTASAMLFGTPQAGVDRISTQVLYLNITASTQTDSKVYFSLPADIVLGELVVWANHSDSVTLEGPYPVVLEHEDAFAIVYSFTTDRYSEFFIGEEYPVCSEGAITQPCLCGGSPYDSGYCCSGTYRTRLPSAPLPPPPPPPPPPLPPGLEGAVQELAPAPEPREPVVHTVTAEMIEESYEAWLNISDSIAFGSTILTLESLNASNVTLTLLPIAQERTLAVNESWAVDLSGDGVEDSTVRIIEIEPGRGLLVSIIMIPLPEPEPEVVEIEEQDEQPEADSVEEPGDGINPLILFAVLGTLLFIVGTAYLWRPIQK